MSSPVPVSPESFEAIQNVDIDKLSRLSKADIRPILPCLVRMSLCAPLDSSDRWTQERKKVLKCLSGLEVVNSLVGLLSIDFQALEEDSRKEQQLRVKLGGQHIESVLISQLEQSVALEFERTDAARKLRLLLSELLFIMAQIKEPKAEFYHKSSELFESEVYLEEVSDVLCIAQAELPSLLRVAEVAEALLHVENGSWLLCRLITNVPDTFHEVCVQLVSNGEIQDEDAVGGQKRAAMLKDLCRMNPTHALTVRALCVEHCRMPGLAVALTLDYGSQSNSGEVSNSQSADSPDGSSGAISDVAAFVSGLLLSNNSNVRSWFAVFLSSGQKRRDAQSTVFSLRQHLLAELTSLLPEAGKQLREHQVVQGCALIRLYCAMKKIAGLKLDEQEGKTILQLVLSHPPPTQAGARFLSVGLCMLLSFPYLLASTEQEKQAIEWIRWQLRVVGQFEKVSGAGASFGEMLLLIAIHFHSGQHNAKADLVSNTLGMKSAVKANALSRMKVLFTQEIFTEQVVTSHAVRVPVTKGLNSSMSGYLPIHCIYQLLKSRAFSKHKVPIKEWIYQQICTCTTPVHPLVPSLIEVYINSIIVPSAKTDRTNEPITEQEILAVFADSSNQESAGPLPMDVSDGEVKGHKTVMTSQLLLVYYVLLYQDTLLTNMKSIATSNRKVAGYSAHLLAQLPMKYLLHEAQKEQQLYAGLFAPLLRLLSSHYPHLCLVEDWLQEEMNKSSLSHSGLRPPERLRCTAESLQRGFEEMQKCPAQILLQLEELSVCSAKQILPFADKLMENLPELLRPDVPRKVKELVKSVWLTLNTIIPCRLRVMTVNALRPQTSSAFTATPYTEDDLTLDPLITLRCDQRVFRCGPLFDLTLRVLEAFLQASRAQLSAHIQATPDKPGQSASLVEREELKTALLATQDSAVVQMLLECCLPSETDTKQAVSGCSMLSDLREVQCLVCSYLHQKFIADPNLAKLVHFQGYPSELLPVTVAGIPSMHICLDFIPELLQQPHLDKQMFAVELVSHLCVQYALPKSLSIAKLAVNVLSTLLQVLSSDQRPKFFLPTLPALVRVSRVFPSLCDDIVALLIQLGRICNSHISAVGNSCPSGGGTDVADEVWLLKEGSSSREHPSKEQRDLSLLAKYTQLSNSIQKTFTEIVQSSTRLKQSLQ